MGWPTYLTNISEGRLVGMNEIMGAGGRGMWRMWMWCFIRMGVCGGVFFFFFFFFFFRGGKFELEIFFR
ncbi:hypothetical protein DM02DRAFT_339222 [Periconia macrospinosa]|uniref:Transmembrane protein n=1 Tax=Periconia macrospinosa TaxID=97972 RepID=A0A2V1DTP6_9PLEO|nr:hypothetical protein DM02DRAFT_339222 [Periconia macrospinosa]